jgi:hypothetical protein
MGQFDFNNSCFFNYNSSFGLPPIPIKKNPMSSTSLGGFVDIIHNIFCVDIVHYNTINLWSSRSWTYFLSTTCSLHLRTCIFWQTFTQTPLSNLLTQAHHQFYTWLLYADCFTKSRIYQQVRRVAALLHRFMFLRHNFQVYSNCYCSIDSRASWRYLSHTTFQPHQLQRAYALYHKNDVHDRLLSWLFLMWDMTSVVYKMQCALP